jgi:hypothetical protein
VSPLSIIAIGSAVLTPAANPEYIETAWIVQADQAQVGERIVRDGEYVLRHRLLPPSLIELSDDAVDTKSGKVLARAGDQLFGLLTRGAPVFCVSSVPNQNLARSLLFGSGNLQRCLIDADSDGRLDGSFNAGNAIPGLPNFARQRPKKPKAVSGGTYKLIDPTLQKEDYFVAIRYEGRSLTLGKGPLATFSVRFGTEGNLGSLTRSEMPTTAAFPFDLSVLQARFTVLARDGETIRVNVSQAIPEQRFGVIQTVRFY